MSRGINSKIFLTSLLLVFAFCLHNPINTSASVIDESIDGMSGFKIIGDDRVWLDIKNVNIFGKTYTEMETWADANGWRFATHSEFIELLGALVPTYLYSSPTYDDTVTGHFNENEAIIIGANDMPYPPLGEIQFFRVFIDENYDERHVGVFEQDDDEGNFFHSYWGVDDNPSLSDIVYYGNESALLIKNDTGQGAIPEPATLMLFGAGLLGLAGVSRKKRQ